MSDTIMDEQMSPDSSPGNISKKTGVRRANNMPLYLLGGAGFIFVVIMAVVAGDRSKQQFDDNNAAEKTKAAGNTKMFANEITGDYLNGIIPADKPKPVKPKIEYVQQDLPPMPVITVARPENFDLPPAPPEKAEDPMLEEEKNRIRQFKMQQFLEAVKAKTNIQYASPKANQPHTIGSSNSNENLLSRLSSAQNPGAVNSNDLTTAYKASLRQLQDSGIMPGSSSINSSEAPTLLNLNTSSNNTKEDRWTLNSKPEAPNSAYEIRSGFVIPGTMISGINSELPGQITAQVAQNVYDTPTGNYLLIPQGSRLVGQYSSDVAFGQSRVLIAWQRIIFPDGKAMDIGDMPGADNAGYSGFNDLVNNHYLRIFGSAVLMSAVTAGIALSQERDNDQSGDSINASQAMSEALGQQLGSVTAQLIAKNMNIAPTLEIRPGYRFNIIVTKDMNFSKPYQNFDYQVQL